MRNRKYVWLVPLLVVALVLSTAGAATARAIKTPFTGTEVWVEDLEPGTERFLDHNLYLIRGNVARFTMEVSDPRVSGDDVVVINWNFKLVDPPVYGTGRMWGTFRITNAGGYWEGTWTGYRDERGFSYLELIGAGADGYAGLKLHMHIERLDPDPKTPETVTGYILESEN